MCSLCDAPPNYRTAIRGRSRPRHHSCSGGGQAIRRDPAAEVTAGPAPEGHPWCGTSIGSFARAMSSVFLEESPPPWSCGLVDFRACGPPRSISEKGSDVSTAILMIRPHLFVLQVVGRKALGRKLATKAKNAMRGCGVSRDIGGRAHAPCSQALAHVRQVRSTSMPSIHFDLPVGRCGAMSCSSIAPSYGGICRPNVSRFGRAMSAISSHHYRPAANAELTAIKSNE